MEVKETRPFVDWELINSFMIDVFKAYGVPEEDAAICADVLLEADRRGRLLTEKESCRTTLPGVYAGGDAVTGAATVILAMGAGREAAAEIDEDLRKKSSH